MEVRLTSNPIQFPWVVTHIVNGEERIAWCKPWNCVQAVWRCRELATTFNGEFYRVVPMPITGSM